MHGIKPITCFFTITAAVLACLPATATQAETGNVVLWNKLGSATEIATSEIGPGFQQLHYLIGDWDQAQLAPGVFGDGLYVNHDTCEGWCNDGANFFVTDLSQTGLSPARGSIEFWFEFKYGADTFNHAYFFDTRSKVMNHYPDQNWQTDGVLTAGWNGWDYGSFGKRFFFCMGKYDRATCIYTPDFSAAPGGELAFSNGTLMHFGFVWDKSGIDNTADTARIYVNGEVKGATQAAWNLPNAIDPFLFLGATPNCCDWDHHYNAVKGITDNLVIRDYANTDFTNRFEENPGLSCEATLPKLAAKIAQKSGLKNARNWTINLNNQSHCLAESAQIDKVELSQSFGARCVPIITTPSAFPLVLGDIPDHSQGTGNVGLNFSNCPNNARFSATITFSSNGGAVSGSKTFNNQFR